MLSKRKAKKKQKQLIRDYYGIVSPDINLKHIVISKDIVDVEQNFEFFSLYKRNAQTITSNKTVFINELNENMVDA
ncbi:MAG TPA: hypothetical protein PK239_05450 [Chitinophagales bacterium]|mgnify:CR=1 FL=1|nr:hypothetical protein [Chitinophagales bacterium]